MHVLTINMQQRRREGDRERYVSLWSNQFFHNSSPLSIFVCIWEYSCVGHCSFQFNTSILCLTTIIEVDIMWCCFSKMLDVASFYSCVICFLMAMSKVDPSRSYSLSSVSGSHSGVRFSNELERQIICANELNVWATCDHNGPNCEKNEVVKPKQLFLWLSLWAKTSTPWLRCDCGDTFWVWFNRAQRLSPSFSFLSLGRTSVASLSPLPHSTARVVITGSGRDRASVLLACVFMSECMPVTHAHRHFHFLLGNPPGYSSSPAIDSHTYF